MKVNEIMKKVHYARAKLPVYLQEGAFGESRKAESTDYQDYYYPEKNKTVAGIELLEDRVVIYYYDR